MFCLACGSFEFYAAAQAAPGHHAPEGFRNNYPHPGKESFWAWKWAQLREGVPPPPPGGWNFPHMKTDAAALRANGKTYPKVIYPEADHAVFHETGTRYHEAAARDAWAQTLACFGNYLA